MNVIPNTRPVVLCVPDPECTDEEPFAWYSNGGTKHYQFEIVGWIEDHNGFLFPQMISEKVLWTVSVSGLAKLHPELDFTKARILTLPRSRW